MTSLKKTIEIALTTFLTIELLFVGAIAGAIFHYSSKTTVEIDSRAAIAYVRKAGDTLTKAVQNPLVLSYGDEKITVPAKDVQTWTKSKYSAFTDRVEIGIDDDALQKYLEELAPAINTVPTNGKFEMVDGILRDITPSLYGTELDIEKSIKAIAMTLKDNALVADLAIDQIEPEISLEKLEDLGITTLLGKGTSDYTGSSVSRATNIKVGAEKFNGIILRPDEEFSFNNLLGPITSKEGYVPGQVIKGGKIVDEYGGGICQVSTTMFRSAFEAGLEITERRAHSLPVRYYKPQGYDSTIYPGVVDLRFVNNTPSYMLIQTKLTPTTLAFEMYGQDDGRKVVVDEPVVLQASTDGSLKTRVTRHITSGEGETKREDVYSSYKSPALFEVIRNPLE